MPFDPQQLIDSPLVVRFVAAVTRAIPPAVGYPLCNLIGNWAATRRQSHITRAVRLNQWVVRGASLDKPQLDRVVRETLQNNVRDLFDLYHYLQKPDVIRRKIRLTPLVEELIERPEFAGRGLIIVGLHLSSFDSILQSVCRQGLKPLILTIPEPRGGRRVEFELRRQTGMNLIPASVTALRRAVRHLERGGLVLTGVDRPVEGSRLHPHFFGQTAALPTHHIHLAIKARVPVVIIAAIREMDGSYRLFNSDLMEIESFADHDTEILRNAERVLEQAEHFIRLAPQQWNVPLPVWPDLWNRVPGGS